jgi:hypothetical protein
VLKVARDISDSRLATAACQAFSGENSTTAFIKEILSIKIPISKNAKQWQDFGFFQKNGGYPISSRKDPSTGVLFIQRQRLRLRQRLRRVSNTSAARQHGRRRSSQLKNILADFPGKQRSH